MDAGDDEAGIVAVLLVLVDPKAFLPKVGAALLNEDPEPNGLAFELGATEPNEAKPLPALGPEDVAEPNPAKPPVVAVVVPAAAVNALGVPAAGEGLAPKADDPKAGVAPEANPPPNAELPKAGAAPEAVEDVVADGVETAKGFDFGAVKGVATGVMAIPEDDIGSVCVGAVGSLTTSA